MLFTGFFLHQINTYIKSFTPTHFVFGSLLFLIHVNLFIDMQEVLNRAVALKEEANKLYKRQQYLPASKKYNTAWSWIRILVNSELPENDSVSDTVRSEAIKILGNLSAAMLKLEELLLAIVAATKCIKLNEDGSYVKVRLIF